MFALTLALCLALAMTMLAFASNVASASGGSASFLQATILVAGLMVIREHALLGLGLMLSAGEVPRIAGTFGLDTTTRANIMSAVYTAQAAVNTTKAVAAAIR